MLRTPRNRDFVDYWAEVPTDYGSFAVCVNVKAYACSAVHGKLVEFDSRHPAAIIRQYADGRCSYFTESDWGRAHPASNVETAELLAAADLANRHWMTRC